jgi:hypothetical protein
MANSGSVAGVFVPYTKWKKLISDGNTNLTARLEGDVIVQVNTLSAQGCTAVLGIIHNIHQLMSMSIVELPS